MRGAGRRSEYLRLGRLLREARENAGLSQRQLSRRLNCVSSVVAKIEIGERRIDVIELFEVARALGLDPAQFTAQLADKFSGAVRLARMVR